jgi:hypothetical protein
MWAPDWTFAAVGADAQINLDFPPSYVHRGSAVAEVVRRGEVRRFGPFDADGYDREWLEVAAILNGAAPRYDLDHLRADIVYALDLAEACAKEVAR